MTTSIAIIILAILDIYILREMVKHETAIVVLLRKNGILEEEYDDE